MRLISGVAIIFSATILTACDSPGGGVAPAGYVNTPEYVAMSDAAYNVAMSEVLADMCPIVTTSQSENDVTRIVALEMLKREDLDLERLSTLTDNPSVERELVRDAVERLIADPDLENPAAACTRAQKEIKSGSLTGRLLKQG